MTYELFVARRYLKSKQRSGFLSVISFMLLVNVVVLESRKAS